LLFTENSSHALQKSAPVDAVFIVVVNTATNEAAERLFPLDAALENP
jgi:hypothetical protein